MKLLLPALVVAISALGADLDDLRAAQQKLLAARTKDDLSPYLVPLELVKVAKGQLLSWAESRLEHVGRNVDTVALSDELRASIQLPPAAGFDLLGELDVSFSRPNGEPAWLQMSTDVGIPCGFDRSLYLYEWRDNRWARRFALEANDDREEQYGPQQSTELQVSAPDAKGARMVLITGTPPFCMSLWQTLYIRLFRVDTGQTLLLEQTPLARILEGPANYSARLEPAGARIEFYGFDNDPGIFIRKYVLRYRVNNGKIRRIEPTALSHLDFVDEWLSRPWAEIAAYSRPQLAAWHDRLYKGHLLIGEYRAEQRCANPGEWQVSFKLDKSISYFSVLDRGANRYRMLSVSENPRPDCSGPNELFGPPKK
jgi:hypothetical protein